MAAEDLISLAKRTAAAYGLDPALVCAVCEQESNWTPSAIRYEPGFYKKYVEPQSLKSSTEAQARAFSWGVMQAMGQVAREFGFKGQFLSELCNPVVGIDMGCKILKHKFDKANGDLRKTLLLWNGGSRPEYVDEVLARVDKYR